MGVKECSVADCPFFEISEDALNFVVYIIVCKCTSLLTNTTLFLV